MTGNSPGPNQHEDNEDSIYMDTSKPLGDACREDGTLKDASEIQWRNSPTSPTEHNRAVIEELFPDDTSELELERRPPSSGPEPDEAPKKNLKVRYTTGSSYGTLTETHRLASERIRVVVDRSSTRILTQTSRCKSPHWQHLKKKEKRNW